VNTEIKCKGATGKGGKERCNECREPREAEEGELYLMLYLMEIKSSNPIIPQRAMAAAKSVSRDTRATQAEAAAKYKSQAQAHMSCRQ
jgi:hypothetical protein